MSQTINELVRVELTKNQHAALQSFIDDRGILIFKNSKLLKVINAGDLELVPTELKKWVVENGKQKDELVALRTKEIELFQSNS